MDDGLGAVFPLYPPPVASPDRPLPVLLGCLGLDTDDVDTVVLSHTHRDHNGWGVSFNEDGGVDVVPTFPHATHLVQRKDWLYAESEGRERTAFETLLQPLQEAGLVEFLDGPFRVTRKSVLSRALVTRRVRSARSSVAVVGPAPTSLGMSCITLCKSSVRAGGLWTTTGRWQLQPGRR